MFKVASPLYLAILATDSSLEGRLIASANGAAAVLTLKAENITRAMVENCFVNGLGTW